MNQSHKSICFTAGAILALFACKPRTYNGNNTSDSRSASLVKTTENTVCEVETDSTVANLYKAAQDPFKTKILSAANCKVQLGKKDPYSIDSFMTAAGCKPGKRFLVSEKGQLKVTKETALDPRSVDEWICASGVSAGSNPDVSSNIEGRIWISGPGSAMHIISWDSVNKTFNFYSADHPTDGGQIFFHGNSHTQAVTIKNTFRHACTNCHVGGGLLMKELRFPWPFWHTPVSPLPGVAEKKWSRATDSAHPVEIGEFFEIQTIQALAAANQSYVNKLREGVSMGAPLPQNPVSVITYKSLLYPLFCERGNGIAASVSSYNSGKVNVPPDLILNRLLVPKNGKVSLTDGIDGTKKGQTSRLDMTGFADDTDYQGVFENIQGGSRVAEFDKSQWLTVAKTAFSIKDGAANPDGDVFPMLVPSRLFADDDLVSRLVKDQIIPEDFATNVLMTDIQNPMYSSTRCGLLSKVPDTPVASGTAVQASGIDMVAKFETAVAADPTKSNAGSGAAKYFAMKAVADKASFVNNFAKSCKTTLKDPLKAAKAMALRWVAFKKPAPGIGAAFVSTDFNRSIEDFVENAAVPQVSPSFKPIGITQGCEVN